MNPTPAQTLLDSLNRVPTVNISNRNFFQGFAIGIAIFGSLGLLVLNVSVIAIAIFNLLLYLAVRPKEALCHLDKEVLVKRINENEITRYLINAISKNQFKTSVDKLGTKQWLFIAQQVLHPKKP